MAMITIILQSSLCWLVFLYVYHFLLRKETFFRFNRYYLFATLTLGLLIPIIRIAWEYIYPTTVRLDSLVVFQGKAQILEFSSFGQSDTINWLTWCTKLYWVGVLTFVLFLIKQIGTIIHMTRLYPKQKLNEFTLVRTDYEHLPFSFLGFVFISDKIEFKDEELRRILRLESSHVKGAHSLVVLWIELIKAIAWFSPLVYWYKSSMRNTHEYLADALVLKSSDTDSYGQLLIRSSQQNLQMALANHFIYSQFKNRINMMMKLPSKPRNVWKYTLVIPVILMLGIMFAYKSADINISGLSSLILNHQRSDTLPEKMLYFLNGEKSTETEIKKILPQQIVSMHIIKDPKALKSYGEEGKNGVSLIVTRTLYLLDGVEITKDANDISTLDMVKYFKEKGIMEFHTTVKSSNSSMKEEEPLKFVEEMPRYPEGDAMLLKFLAENIKYPNIAKEAGVQGRVITQFVVEKDGSISRAKIVKGIGGGCDEEALRVLNLMKPWIPGKNNGEAVPVLFIFPIKFSLQSGNNNSKNINSLEPPPPIIENLTNKINNDKNKTNGFDRSPPPPPLVVNQTAQEASHEEPQKFVEVMPLYPGGEAKLLEFLGQNLRYPKEARDAGIQGRVILSFVVEKDGRISRSKIMRGIGGGCDEEALRVISIMDPWIPGKDNGVAVPVQYTFPVSFKLEGSPKPAIEQDVNNLPTSKSSELKIIPNSAKQAIDLLWNFSGKINIDIIDISGRIALKTTFQDFRNTQSIDVSTLARGTYIIRATKGEISEEQKLILQ